MGQKRNKFTAELELIYYIFYNPDEIEERRMWLMKDLFHVKTCYHSYVWQHSSQIYMSLYTVLPLLSYALMKKNHKNVVCIEGPRQVLSRNSYKQ